MTPHLPHIAAGCIIAYVAIVIMLVMLRSATQDETTEFLEGVDDGLCWSGCLAFWSGAIAAIAWAVAEVWG